MDRFDFYKDLFYRENQRRVELNNDVSILITILFAIVTASFFMLSQFNREDEKLTIVIFFFIFYLMTLFFFIIAVYYLVNSFKGYTYQELPFASELEDHYNKLSEYFEKLGQSEMTNSEFKEDIIKNYFIKNLDVNSPNNDKKALNLFKVRKYVTISSAFCFLLFIPFIMNYIISKDVDNSMFLKIENISHKGDQPLITDSSNVFILIKSNDYVRPKEKAPSSSKADTTSSTTDTTAAKNR